MRTEAAPVIRLEDYRPPEYLIDRIHLDVRLAPSATRVVSRLSVRRRDGTPVGVPLALDGDGLALQSLALDGADLAATAFEATPDRLVLHAPPPGPFRLEIVTEIDPSANTALMGLYRSNGVYTTQCEAEGFRRITYFLDRPDVLSVYTTRIEAERGEAPVLLGNGNCIETGEVPGTSRHFAVWHDPFPKPSYLFALVGGALASIHDEFTASGRHVRLGIYCEPGKEARCGYAMEALKEAMRWDEQRFGREYDLDVFNIVAVSDFNMGAMENKGLNIFNDKYVLVDAETGTDDDFAYVEAVIAHEYFHNWTGNRITCRDWFQLCLKEGLTVYRDQEFSSDMRSRAVERIGNVAALRQQQFPEDAGPLAHPPRPTAYREINNFYTATVYEKGAEICRMLPLVVGEAGFRAGMDLYFARHDGTAATIEDYLACFADATGVELAQFARWYQQAGTPTVTISHAYDPEAEELSLQLRQDLPETPDRQPKQPLHIPVAFGLVGPDGQDLSHARSRGTAAVADGVIHLTNGSADLVLEGVRAPAIPSLFRGFSAPVHVRSDLSLAQRLFLIGHDADPFNRWEATQQIALDTLRAAVGAIREGKSPDFDPRFADALERLAGNDGLDPAFRAQALTLPSEIDIAQAIGRDIDPDAIHQARRALQAFLGRTLAAAATEAAERAAPDPAYSPDARNAGRRALAHAARALSVAAGAADGADILRAFHAASNMTDRMTALRLLVHYGLPGSEEALAAFFDRFRDNPLVIDKWFAVQATRPDASTLDRVQALSGHPSFSFKTPNRVYALIRTFVSANPVGFNRRDGAGYRYLAEVIGELDGQNPSVAARLATAFRSFRMLEPERQAHAEAALRRVAAAERLSRDVGDIVSRTLDG